MKIKSENNGKGKIRWERGTKRKGGEWVLG